DEFAITEPTSVEAALKSELKFNLYPNPAKSNCTIDFELESTAKLNMQLKDLQGREVQSKIELNLGAGKHSQQINLSNLRTGLYFLEVQTEKGSFVHKLWVE
ncbi:MAG: T9SS type A sorting domain-containing protein, partial [Bacteroidetes bacterium]|nr:T9SS type A sorting domain-containing protein [Bacteroidota bacterium]